MVKEKEHCDDSRVAATGEVASYPAWPLALCTYNPAIIGKLGTPSEHLAGKAWLGVVALRTGRFLSVGFLP
jgi:hypothetical protein